MSEKGDFSKLDSIDCCPMCGKEVERGYIITEGIRWDTRKHKLAVGSARRIGPRPWILNNFTSLKCEPCGILILDYRSEENKL